ncbi:MAG: hypothetical protein IPI14_00045 [Polaromonas sp.]|nr:hypothetical protein [Polaromonas sp.]
MRTITFRRKFLPTGTAIVLLTTLPIALQAQQQQKVSGPQARWGKPKPVPAWRA